MLTVLLTCLDSEEQKKEPICLVVSFLSFLCFPCQIKTNLSEIRKALPPTPLELNFRHSTAKHLVHNLSDSMYKDTA